MGDKADLGMGLTFLEVVVADLESFQVIPLRVGVNDVLLQLDVGDGAIGVVGVDNIAICPYRKRNSATKRGNGRITPFNSALGSASPFCAGCA